MLPTAMNRRRRKPRSAIVGVGMALALAALAAGTVHAMPLVALAERPEAPPLRMQGLDGATVDLRDHRGTVVVLNFWAAWCLPCRKELASLQRGAAALSPQGVTVLLVNQGDSADRARDLLSLLAIHLPTVLDPDLALAGRWQLQGLPTTYVVDPAGRIALGAVGDRDWDDPQLIAQIASLMGH